MAGTVLVIDTIKQKNALNFPIVDATDILGGHYQVDTFNDRDNIPYERRKELMLCSVIDNGKTYQLKGGIDNYNWREFSTSGSSTTYIHPSDGPTTGFYRALSGPTVLGSIGINTSGHVTEITSRTLTAGDIDAALSTHTHSEHYTKAETYNLNEVYSKQECISLYYTKQELLNSAGSYDKIDWSHIKNAPSIGSNNWLSPVETMNDLNAIDTTEFIGGECVLVQSNASGNPAQYVWNLATQEWVKIAEVGWITYSHPTNGGGSLSGLTGGTVLSGIFINTEGHVSGTTTRNITLEDIGGLNVSNVTNDKQYPNTSAIKIDESTGLTVSQDVNTVIFGMSPSFKTVSDGTNNLYAAQNQTLSLVAGQRMTLNYNVDTNTITFNAGESTPYEHPQQQTRQITQVFAGNQVLSSLNISNDNLGHVTSLNLLTRELSLLDIGFTGDSNANYYEHPESHPAEIILEDSTHRFVTDDQISTWTAGSSIYTLPQATEYSLGGVMIGSGINVTDGLISVTMPDPYEHPTYGSGYIGPFYGSEVLTGITVNDTGHIISATSHYMSCSDIGAALEDHSHLTVNSESSGFMSIADKIKLDELVNYTHPSTHPAGIIIQDGDHRFVTDVQISSWDYKLDQIPEASSEVLGGIRVGSGLSIAEGGVLSVAAGLDINQYWTKDDLIANNGIGNKVDWSQLANIPTISGDFIHPTFTPVNESITTSGPQVINNLTIIGNNEGHLQTVTVDTRTLTLTELGYEEYQHPTFHTPEIIAEDEDHRFVTDTQVTSWDAKADISYVDGQIDDLIDSSPDDLNTLNKIAIAINNDPDFATTITTSLSTKVDVEVGKGLSTNDFDNTYKTKVDELTAFTLPTASDTVLGGIKIGTGLAIDIDGIVTVTAGAGAYTHPLDGAGSLSDLSGSTILSGITVNNEGHVTGTTTRELSLLDIGFTGDSNANHYEHPVSHPATIITEDSTHRFVTDDQITIWNNAGSLYDLPVASATTLGGIKVGDGLTIDDGVLSAEAGEPYVHPSSHPAEIITQDSTHRFVTDTQIISWDAKADTSYVDTQINNLIDSSPDALNTLNELAAALGNDANFAGTVTVNLANKVDKEVGKGLSTNDFDNTYKTKLDGLSNYILPTASDTVLGGIKIGTGLAIDGAGVVSVNGPSTTNSFSTIAVSGQSSVSADSATDTLTLVAGLNITITTDDSTDTITIASTGGSPEPSGDYLNTIADVSVTPGTITSNHYLSGIRYFKNADVVNFNVTGISAQSDITINPSQFVTLNPQEISSASLSGSGPYNYFLPHALNETTSNLIFKSGERLEAKINSWKPGFWRKSPKTGILIDNVTRTPSTYASITGNDELVRYTYNSTTHWLPWDSTKPLTSTDAMTYNGHIRRQFGDWRNVLPNSTSPSINYDYLNSQSQFYYTGLHMPPGTGDNQYGCFIRISGTRDGVNNLLWSDVNESASNPLVKIWISFDCVPGTGQYLGDSLITWHNLLTPYTGNWTDGYGCRNTSTPPPFGDPTGYEITFDSQFTNDDTGPASSRWGMWIKIEFPAGSEATIQNIEIVPGSWL